MRATKRACKKRRSYTEPACEVWGKQDSTLKARARGSRAEYSNGFGVFVLCDKQVPGGRCNTPAHLSCVGLSKAPSGSWHCKHHRGAGLYAHKRKIWTTPEDRLRYYLWQEPEDVFDQTTGVKKRGAHFSNNVVDQ